MKILITGATGNVGSRLVKILTSGGHSVRAFTRTGDASRFGSQVEVVSGDFTDKASLRKALEGVSRMYLLTTGYELASYEANAIEAAKGAKLELLVKQSVAGAQYKATEIPRWHRAGEELIEASGIPYIFLRPAPFDSNSLLWASTIKSHDTVYGALGEASTPSIDPEDIAAVAAAVLTKPELAGRAYELTGPESLTTQQQVDVLAKVLGRPLKYANVPDEAARDSMLGMGWPPPYVNAMVGLIQTLRAIGNISPTADVKTVLGREPRSFQQWAEANVTSFRSDANATSTK